MAPSFGVIRGTFALVVVALSASQVGGAPSKARTPQLANQLEVGPLIDIWLLQYAHTVSARQHAVVGVAYTNPGILGTIDYPGSIQYFTAELGLRRFVYAGLNAEAIFLASYISSRDDIEGLDYNGFALTAELRVGYQFDFRVRGHSTFVNLQWFAGYKLVNPVSDNFVEVDGGHHYLSPIPIVLLGVRL